MDTSGIIVLVLVATVVLRVVLVAGLAWLLVPVRRACPRCGDGQLVRLCSRAAGLVGLELRWCLACGWTGLGRPVPVSVPDPRAAGSRS